jgi:hypothetical protein
MWYSLPVAGTFSMGGLSCLNYGRMQNEREHHCTIVIVLSLEDRRGRDRMVLGFTTTCAISAYHH